MQSFDFDVSAAMIAILVPNGEEAPKRRRVVPNTSFKTVSRLMPLYRLSLNNDLINANVRTQNDLE